MIYSIVSVLEYIYEYFAEMVDIFCGLKVELSLGGTFAGWNSLGGIFMEHGLDFKSYVNLLALKFDGR